MPRIQLFLPLAFFALLLAACRSPGASLFGDVQAAQLPVSTLTEAPATGQNSPPSSLAVPTTAVPSIIASLPEKSSETCPVTQPPDAPFVPPAPYPPQPPGDDQFWFGKSGLWTALPRSGSWRQLALGEKFWWWSEEFDVSEDTTPGLVVTARRLDGPAPNFQVSEATNGYHQSFHWAMLAGVQLPEPGCWEFTGRYNDHQLSFVLWVPPE